jgi:hypothetical protein
MGKQRSGTARAVARHRGSAGRLDGSYSMTGRSGRALKTARPRTRGGLRSGGQMGARYGLSDRRRATAEAAQRGSGGRGDGGLPPLLSGEQRK